MVNTLNDIIAGLLSINNTLLLISVVIVMAMLAICYYLIYKVEESCDITKVNSDFIGEKSINFLNYELKSVLSNTVNGIIVVDNNRDILIFNKSAVFMLDTESLLNDNPIVTKYLNSLEGRNLDGILDMLNAHEKMKEALNNVIADMYDVEILDGSQKYYTIYVNPLMSVGLSRIGTIYTIDDITEVRTSEIMRRDFASNVSHELKTPLTSIKGFVETLRDGAIDNPDVSDRFLSIIDIEATRLKSLIDDILALSEIEVDDTKEIIDFNITPIMNELSIMMSEIAHIHKVQLVFHGLSKDPSSLSYFNERYIISGRPNWFKQMIINMVDNAIKYSSGVENARVDVFFYRVDSNVVVRIEDNGIGIPMESMDRLYEKFYRVDKARGRTKVNGTGLGLSIVKHIIDSFDGLIFVDSVLGAGTTFTVEIPLVLDYGSKKQN